MNSALVIGGTGFVGRHTARELTDQDYDVTTISRDRHGFRFGEEFPITRITADRTDEDALADIARRVGPDLDVDGAAFYPGEVRTATEIFADVEAYIYVSSGGVYDAHAIPKREDETPLHSFSPEQADDESMATYGPRKAECDRETAAAVDRGVTAMSVRPTMIYGPKTVPSSDSASGTTGDEAPSWADDLPGFQGHHDSGSIVSIASTGSSCRATAPLSGTGPTSRTWRARSASWPNRVSPARRTTSRTAACARWRTSST
jgi:nucleoside-diphosphate-sugar epimerase